MDMQMDGWIDGYVSLRYISYTMYYLLSDAGRGGSCA